MFSEQFVTSSNENVVFAANTANARSVIFTFTCPAGLRVQLRNQALLVMELKTSAGVHLEQSALVYLAYKNPGAPGEVYLLEREYMLWRRTALADQTNRMKNSELRIAVNIGGKPYLDRYQDMQLLIAVKAAAVLDVDNSRIELQTFQTPAGRR